jgi:integrase/recombinase XerD
VSPALRAGAPRSEPSPLAALLPPFLRHAEACGMSPHTVLCRRSTLSAFVRWCEERGTTLPEEITREVLEHYRLWLYQYRQEDGTPFAWNTQAHRLGDVKRFLAWMVETGRLFYSPAADLALPRRPKALPGAVLTAEETEAVLARPDLEHPVGLRDRAILEVLYSTAIRRSELCGLDLSDVDRGHQVLWVRLGKGRKDRVVPIGRRALEWVHRYLRESRPRMLRGVRDRGALFVTLRGRRIGPKYLSERVARYLEAAGFDGSCHLFRHTAATLMLEGGADIRAIQEILGHESLASTQIYTRVSIRHLKEVHARTHPAAESPEPPVLPSFS